MKKFLTKITAFSLPFLLILSFLNVNYTNAASSSEPQIHLQNPDITESEYILQEPSDTKSYEEINIDELETIPPELLEDSDIDSINEPHEEIIDIPASKDEIQYATKNNNPPYGGAICRGPTTRKNVKTGRIEVQVFKPNNAKVYLAVKNGALAGKVHSVTTIPFNSQGFPVFPGPKSTVPFKYWKSFILTVWNLIKAECSE